ncbi:4-(cytidine 5'-diphospho)-2-C-methyl-D-erythritol kinase [Erysipelothrix sp. HDW6A]|uniref:4-(cytidine 5'-diphospho)-2-C-methyl-D-erythritol kinase n=1 Tax=Erysipelothrix sp. HDW6A TaxID=2714928 RepID=UPI00140E3B2B|nr:4-(cytidine 5'-diphospho)-2-C-methyl-D-erythritol kinase [Erysipelothrix sp. HDW6A]QIK56550.1 4-(cytidine 5'-diphospho)-2-C-methyl-D-erythritol kinase [Erysipelothrix sp. HDW6A]
MQTKAYAKLTLCLHVKDRVNGSLHFRNVTVPIDLFDMVYLEKSETMHIETDKKYLPNDKRNTVYKALILLKETYAIKDNFKVRIVKNIPTQSGLGGGSADAAAVIRMINEMYALDLSREELINIARKIDEDTPFCLFNEASIVEGIGDILTPIDIIEPLYYICVKPSFGVSTKGFMKKFDHFQTEDKVVACIEALEEKNYKKLSDNMHNDFQKSVVRHNSRMRKIMRTLREQGMDGVSMSGTGTSVFGLSQDIDEVREAYKRIATKFSFVKYGEIKPKL